MDMSVKMTYFDSKWVRSKEQGIGALKKRCEYHLTYQGQHAKFYIILCAVNEAFANTLL